MSAARRPALNLMLDPVAPLDIGEGLGQLIVPDNSFPGLVRGDRLLVTPCYDWEEDDLYVLSIPDAPLGVWVCQSDFRNGIEIWKDARKAETLRRLSHDEWRAAVVAKIAAWLHVHSSARLTRGVSRP